MNKRRSILGLAVVYILVSFFGLHATVHAVESQRCKLGSQCTVGEFLYDDEYSPITSASCTLTSRNPDGTVYLNAVSMTSAAQNDGWYSYTFDTTGKDEGIYRSQLCCTSGTDYLCLDKTFSIGASYLSTTDVSSAVWDQQVASHSASGTFGENLQTAAPTVSDIWSYSSRSLSSFGTLIADMWSYSARSLTTFGTLVTEVWSSATRTLTGAALEGGGELATKSDVQTGTASAVTSIKGASDKDLTQLSTQVSGVQTTADTINTKVDTLTSNISTITTNVSSILTKWGSYSAGDIITSMDSVQSSLGTSSDDCATATIFGEIQCVRDKWGSQTADILYTAANNAATSSAALSLELGYSGKSTTAYEDAQTLLTNLSTATTAIEAVQTTATSIETKVDTLTTQVSSLSTSLSSVSTNIDTLVSKWSTYTMSDVVTRLDTLQTDLGANSNTCSDDTVFGNVQCIRDKWGSQTADALYTAANNAATTATELQNELDYNGKSTTAYEDIHDLQSTVTAMQGLIGTTTDASTTASLFGRIKKTQDAIDALDTSSADLSGLMDKWGEYSAGDIYDKVKDLSSDIAAVNAVSNVSSILTLSTEAKVDLTTLKNNILSLTALTELNKTLLQEGTSKPIIKTWLEEGSIIFKSLITNPTSVTQTVPFKFYLPKEATKKDIEKIDENLTVGYDPSNEATYVVGEFQLKPHETKTTFVEVQDVWRISKKDIDSLRLQKNELFAPLKGTPLFAQGATLSSNITAALDNVERIQDKANTPEERIQAYREAIIDFNRAKADLQSLNDLLASSGSMSSLLGFVGGVQTLAVWGLIIILITGFVFLALYMRYITGVKEEKGRPLSRIKQKPFKLQITKRILLTRIAPLLSGVVISSLLIIVLGKTLARTSSHDSYVSPVPVSGDTSNNTHVSTSADEEVTIKEPKQVLGVSTTTSKAYIYVDTTGVNVREGPSVDTQITFVIKKDTEVTIITTVDSWSQIEYIPKEGLQAQRGWVKRFFISNLAN